MLKGEVWILIVDTWDVDGMVKIVPHKTKFVVVETYGSDADPHLVRILTGDGMLATVFVRTDGTSPEARRV